MNICKCGHFKDKHYMEETAGNLKGLCFACFRCRGYEENTTFNKET